MSTPDPIVPPATRAAGLERLQHFLPRAGARYRAQRNYDYGPSRRDNVSVLSPWIRHRLVCEEEVARAVLAEHSFGAAEKYIQEVCWRTYWKGWLEMRPEMWSVYRTGVESRLSSMAAATRRRLEDAEAGATGIDCFDGWAAELVETGYLHNHARMWFASIWVFTLGLPWELGADLFLRHLLDGDPASNTLSWRWVAGLHTRGKAYLARADNIARYTEGRFATPERLAREAPVPDEPDNPPPGPLPQGGQAGAGEEVALLLTEEDLHAESLAGVGDVKAVAGLHSAADRSPGAVSDRVLSFTDTALADGLARASGHYGVRATVLAAPAAVAEWALDAGVETVVTPWAPIGPARERLDALEPELALRDVALLRVQRDWDRLFWPHATRGFFKLKERIGPVLADLGVADSLPAPRRRGRRRARG